MQNVTYAEMGGRKVKLVTDYILGTVEIKTGNVQACSLFSSSFSGKRRENSLLLFFFFLFTAAVGRLMEQGRIRLDYSERLSGLFNNSLSRLA